MLANLSQSEFTDDQLFRLCGLQWADFVDVADADRRDVWLGNGVGSRAGSRKAALKQQAMQPQVRAWINTANRKVVLQETVK